MLKPGDSTMNIAMAIPDLFIFTCGGADTAYGSRSPMYPECSRITDTVWSEGLLRCAELETAFRKCWRVLAKPWPDRVNAGVLLILAISVYGR